MAYGTGTSGGSAIPGLVPAPPRTGRMLLASLGGPRPAPVPTRRRKKGAPKGK